MIMDYDGPYGVTSNDLEKRLLESLLLKPESCAELLGVSRSVVYELIRQGPAHGGIESVKLGRSRRIPRIAVVEFIERQRELQAGER